VLLRNVRQAFSGLSRNTFIVTSGSFLADMATEMLTPILPIFVTEVLGASGSIVGLVDGMAQAVRNMVDGLFGPISDKLRARKSIALAGYLLSAIAKPLMGISTVWEGVFAGLVSWTASAPESCRLRAMRLSRPRRITVTKDADSALKASARMRAPSSGRCSPSCFSMYGSSTSA
jgi:hypothetical protein